MRRKFEFGQYLGLFQNIAVIADSAGKYDVLGPIPVLHRLVPAVMAVTIPCSTAITTFFPLFTNTWPRQNIDTVLAQYLAKVQDVGLWGQFWTNTAMLLRHGDSILQQLENP